MELIAADLWKPYEPLAIKVDFLTLTAKETHNVRKLRIHFDERASYLNSNREFVYSWGMQGYRGWAVGNLRYGERADGCVLQAAGKEAAWLVSDIRNWPERVTRMDLAATWLLGEQRESMAEDLYNQYLGRDLSDIQRISPRLVKSFTGSTLYLGKRENQAYARLYDKGGQEGGDTGKIWRLELELKGNKAIKGYTCLSAVNFEQEGMFGYLLKETRKMLLELPEHNLKYGSVPEISLEVSDGDRTLQWLATTVRPVLTRFQKAGIIGEASKAIGFQLGIPHLDDI